MIKNSPKTFKKNIIYSSLFLSCIIACVWNVSFYLNAPFIDFSKHFLSQIYKHLYRPHHNIFDLPDIGGITFYHYVYIALLLASLSLCLIKKILKSKAPKKKQAISSTLLSLVFTAYIFVTIVQTASFFKFFKKEFKNFSGKSTEKNYTRIFKPIYLLPKYTRFRLPGYHRAKFITDMNIKKDPGALLYRALAHFLYPVDIRNIRSNEPFDTVLIFFKKDAVSHIPDGYQLQYAFNDENVIATREN